MQEQAKQHHKHSKTWMQQVNMKLRAKLSKFHIEHTSNGVTVQHIHSIQVSHAFCPRQQLGTLQSREQHATGNIWTQT